MSAEERKASKAYARSKGLSESSMARMVIKEAIEKQQAQKKA